MSVSYLDNEEIKKEINEFLVNILVQQAFFLKQVNKVSIDFRSKIASRYFISASDLTDFNEYQEVKLISEIEHLINTFNILHLKLHQDYLDMMQYHQKVSKEWKDKKNDPKYKTWYEHLVREVLAEKADFREKVSFDWNEINEKVLQLMNRINQISINLIKRKGFPEAKQILASLSAMTSSDFMLLIMDLPDLS